MRPDTAFRPSAKILIPPPGRLAARQQVAAICYRSGTCGIEFLLVRTRGGRWIFPKGGVEPGLTQAQSAALEAFEEAGVHGRIEEMPFARFHLTLPSTRKSEHTDRTRHAKASRKNEDASEKTNHHRDLAHPDTPDNAVTAHLCEVTYLEPPQELYRTPTWFSAEKAKRRLLSDRDPIIGEEMAAIVDRAVSRIRRLGSSARKEFQNDALRKVHFEAFESLKPQLVSGSRVRNRQIPSRTASASIIDMRSDMHSAALSPGRPKKRSVH